MVIRVEQNYVVWRMTPAEARDLAEFLAQWLGPGEEGWEDVRALEAAANQLDPTSQERNR